MRWSARNQLTSDGTHTFSYDKNGNRISDGEGRRIAQTAGGSTTRCVLDVQRGLPAVIGAKSGSDITHYMHGSLGPFAQRNPDASWDWMLHDGLGSVRGVFDGTLQSAAEYDPFGEPIVAPAGTPYGFTGELTDGNGLVYLRARYLAPGLGTFASRDPWRGSASAPRTWNGYAWVEGNVVNRGDPSGMAACEPMDSTSGVGNVSEALREVLLPMSNGIAPWDSCLNKAIDVTGSCKDTGTGITQNSRAGGGRPRPPGVPLPPAWKLDFITHRWTAAVNRASALKAFRDYYAMEVQAAAQSAIQAARKAQIRTMTGSAEASNENAQKDYLARCLVPEGKTHQSLGVEIHEIIQDKFRALHGLRHTTVEEPFIDVLEAFGGGTGKPDMVLYPSGNPQETNRVEIYEIKPLTEGPRNRTKYTEGKLQLSKYVESWSRQTGGYEIPYATRGTYWNPNHLPLDYPHDSSVQLVLYTYYVDEYGFEEAPGMIYYGCRNRSGGQP